MGKPLSRDLELVKNFWRERFEKGSAKEKMRAVLHLERIAMEELKHRRSAKIQKAKQAEMEASAYDPALDPEPESPNDPYARLTFDEMETWRKWKARQDAWKAAHPEKPKPEAAKKIAEPTVTVPQTAP